MQVSELQRLIAANPDRVFVLDVRERDEVAADPLFPTGTAYYAGLPLSVLRMLPQAELAGRIREQVAAAGRDIDTVTLVLSCRSGGRSYQAQALLADVGITAESLDGGSLAWLEQKENETVR